MSTFDSELSEDTPFDLEILETKATTGDVEAQYEWAGATRSAWRWISTTTSPWNGSNKPRLPAICSPKTTWAPATTPAMAWNRITSRPTVLLPSRQSGRPQGRQNLDAVARQLTEADLESLRAEMGEANFESEETDRFVKIPCPTEHSCSSRHFAVGSHCYARAIHHWFHNQYTGVVLAGCGMMPGEDAYRLRKSSSPGHPLATNHTALPLPTLETNLTQSPPATVPATDDGVATYNLALQKDQTGHPVEAAALYSKAADLGVPQAQYNLGYLHEHGKPDCSRISPSPSNGTIRLPNKTCPRPSTCSACCTEGRGVPASHATAFSWLTRRPSNLPVAEYQLGVLYAVGQGVETNAEQAAQWFLRAAEQGVPDAQFQIGHRYAQGEGIEQDIIQAYAWFHVAAIDGKHQAALEAKRGVHARMSSEQVTAGQVAYSKLLEKLGIQHLEVPCHCHR